MPLPPNDPQQLLTLLEKLADSGATFILVGGLAAVAQGAPIATFDIDIVHQRSETNVDVLLRFLRSIHARYRGQPTGRVLPPQKAALLGKGHSLFITDLGPFDALGAIEQGKTYEDLLPHTVKLNLDKHPILVLKLETLIELKRRSTHTKDKLVLPILEDTLRQSRQR